MTDANNPPTHRNAEFPKTTWSLIRTAANPSTKDAQESLNQLASLYWRPIYAYFRCKWNKSHEEAKDLTQDFFSALCEKDFLDRLSPEVGRFRFYIMTALDNFAISEHRKQSRMKRGGDKTHIPFEEWIEFRMTRNDTPEQIFLREWTRTVIDLVLDEMEGDYRKEGKEDHFQLYVMRDLDPPQDADLGYKELAKRFGVSVTDVTNILYHARREFRTRVLKKITDTVTNEEEAIAELKELLS